MFHTDLTRLVVHHHSTFCRLRAVAGCKSTVKRLDPNVKTSLLQHIFQEVSQRISESHSRPAIINLIEGPFSNFCVCRCGEDANARISKQYWNCYEHRGPMRPKSPLNYTCQFFRSRKQVSWSQFFCAIRFRCDTYADVPCGFEIDVSSSLQYDFWSISRQYWNTLVHHERQGSSFGTQTLRSQLFRMFSLPAGRKANPIYLDHEH
jgi:hypothetical protein